MPHAKPTPQHLRVFLASPGDVADERALARRLIEKELPSDPLLRGQVTFEVVSWDDPVAPPPMPATLTPQGAVIQFEGEPSTCDIVIVVLWSRLGTRLDMTVFCKPTGDPYLSGTEWEFENAWNARPRPEILVYRRMEEPKIGMDDPDWTEKFQQYQLAKQFFERFTNPDGSPRGSVTTYETPTAFKKRLETDLKWLLRQRLGKRDTEPGAAMVPVWTDPPYPGLRSFTTEEGPIFFGRGREVDALITRLRDPTQRLLAVVGGSGTGKSSLICAGLLPRLKDGAIEGSQSWPVLTFMPGRISGNPFLALAVRLNPLLPAPVQRPEDEIATVLTQTPQRLLEDADALLAARPPGTELVLFVDQLEELFTLVAEQHRGTFVELLARAAGAPRLRVLTTLRVDFLPQAMAEPVLAPLLQAGTFPLGLPGPAALTDIIRKPAERAGLDLEDGLDNEILKDAGGDAGALPLVAFCLEELYRQTAPGHRLTIDAYRAISGPDGKGLRGAIGRRAGAFLDVFQKAEKVADLDAVLAPLFQVLVHVDATGKAARQWAPQDRLMAVPQPIPRLIETLIQERLLLVEEEKDASGRAVVTLAHEALIEEWPALQDWLDRNRAQMQRVQRLLLNLGSSEPDDRFIRGRVAEALGQMGPAAIGAVPALITAMGDADEYVRRRVAKALGQIGSAAAVPTLIKALGDVEIEVRLSAAEALGRLGPTAAEVVPALITALGDADKDVRGSAADALGRIGPTTAEVVPALITALGDADKDVRGSARGALEQIGPALLTALGNADADVRWGAVSALGGIGPAAADAVPALITALDDADADVRSRAAWALGQIGPIAVPALTIALQEPNEKVIKAAKATLEWIQHHH